MKNLIYVLIGMLMVACGSNTNTSKDYEKAITDFLMKGKSKSADDYNLKVEILTEQGKVTVADSIAYLTDEFKKDKQLIINRISLAKEMSEDLLAKEKKRSGIDKRNADIAVMNARIDSLKNLTPDNLQGYDSQNPDDILAVIIRAKYSFGKEGTEIAEIFDFYLSPNGTVCYKKNKAK